MSDEQWLHGLRDAARRADEEPVGEELAAPLGDDFQAKVRARIANEREGGQPAHAAPPANAGGTRTAPARHRWLRAAVPLAATLALAAAILLVARGRGEGPALPDYVSVVGGGEQSLRGDPAASSGSGGGGKSRSFRRDSRFIMTLQPSREAGKVEARFARLVEGGDRAQAVEASHRISPSGSVSVEGRAGDLLGTTPGQVTFVVVVAPAGHMPPDWIDAARDGAPVRGVRAARESVMLLAE